MTLDQNPFTIRIVQSADEFCNRTKEIKELKAYAINGENVMLYSPRRYGKSSLVMIVQKELQKEGLLTAYVDLFPITSKVDLVQRIANGFVTGIGKGIQTKSLLDKIKGLFQRIRPTISMGSEGINFSFEIDLTIQTPLLLEDLMNGICHYVEKNKLHACIALDEFQEITELEESKEIEGILRSHIQTQKRISYYFIGSRRRILQDMFHDKNRPFYKSAYTYPLEKIAKSEFVPFIIKQFARTNKKCPEKIASSLYDKVAGYPYYVQKLSYILWENSEKKADEEKLTKSFEILLYMEKNDFESIWNGLSLGQKTLLKTLAKDPTHSLYAKSYLKKNQLSLGGTQKAIQVLLSKDLIEEAREEVKLTDPIMAVWLRS